MSKPIIMPALAISTISSRSWRIIVRVRIKAHTFDSQHCLVIEYVVKAGEDLVTVLVLLGFACHSAIDFKIIVTASYW